MNIPNGTDSKEWIAEEVNKLTEYPGGYTGRGIVMCAGGLKYLVNAYCAIRLLREKGCKLPIQAWYLGKAEEIPAYMEAIKELGVEFVDAVEYNKNLVSPHIHLNGWELKPFVIIHSKFEEVLYLDADVFVDEDPEQGFGKDAYFMPDFNKMASSNPWWEFHGIKFREEQEFESGIIYVNKQKCWKELNLTNKLCEYGDLFVWKMSRQHGDKDSFRAAWHILETPYYQEKTLIHRLDCTMVQHLMGRPIFYHRNYSKLELLTNKKIAGFKNEDKLFGYIEDLKKIYNPHVVSGGSTSGLDNTHWLYVRYKIDSREMEFLNGKIIKGAGGLEHTYCTKDNNLFILSDQGDITCELEPWKEGYIGRWNNHEKCLILLIRGVP